MVLVWPKRRKHHGPLDQPFGNKRNEPDQAGHAYCLGALCPNDWGVEVTGVQDA